MSAFMDDVRGLRTAGVRVHDEDTMIASGRSVGADFEKGLESMRPSSGDEARRKSRVSAKTLRYVSLLYTCFFFIEPYYQHSQRHWLIFAAFYACFLLLYFGIVWTEGALQKTLIGCMFALAFVYFPYNVSASGAFVYPIVMLAFTLRRTDLYITALCTTIAGIALETWYFKLPPWTGVTGVFFCVVIGLSNLAYSREQEANRLLQGANEEIEHLAQVAERERIARDLHDLLGHTLTVITIKSELANRLMDRDPERARVEMLEVEQTARQALAEVREAVVGYRSEGFAAEVVRAKRTLAAANVALLSTVDVTDMSPAETNVLSLCLRESVTNIVRHARATECCMSVRSDARGLLFTVKDDGTGSASDEGNGLRGMRERVETLGGRLKLKTAVGSGMHLVVELPANLRPQAVEGVQA